MDNRITEINWPIEFMELKRIEDLMLCGICYEYLKTSVMTSCSHNYCSLCIRKYLHYKTECPACFKQTYEKDLRTNRILDEMIGSYLKIREKLGQCILGNPPKLKDKVSESNSETNPSPTPPARTKPMKKDITPIKSPVNPMTTCTPEMKKVQPQNEVQKTVVEKEKVVAKNFASPSTSRPVKTISSFFSSPSSKPCIPVVKTVPCPVCNVDVSEKFINRHLDDCLKRQNSSREEKKTEEKRRPLPKLVLNVMKETELRRKIKELGLSTQGDRKTLEARYHRYTILYNAECDKKNPRSVQELIKQCEIDEAQESKLKRMTEMGIKLQVNRNLSDNIIEKEQKKYREQNRNCFQSLIEDIKKRQKNKNPEEESPSKSMHNDVEVSNESVTSNEDNFIAMEDSFNDSCSPCPLQRYNGDLISGRLTTELSDSSAQSTPAKANLSSSLNLSKMNVTSTPCSSRKKSVYDQTTDSDSESSEDIFATSPEEERRFKKKLKLSEESEIVRRSISFDENNESAADNSFSGEFAGFITSKTSSLTNNEDEKSIGEAEQVDNRDVSCDAHSRPIRKRNRNPKKADETLTTESTTDATKKVLHEATNENVEVSSIDSLLKRRRGRPRKVVKLTDLPKEMENLPKRPLRKAKETQSKP